MPHPNTLTVAARFNGPPGSANGGYLSGRLAQLLTGDRLGSEPVAVTLRKPPPLATPMSVIAGVEGAALQLTSGQLLIAEAAAASLTGVTVEAVGADQADAAALYYGGLVEHPFPTCFVCGLARPRSDGLRLRPGRLPGQPDTTATTWTPDASLTGADGLVATEYVWAALDCPGGWTVDLVGRPMVLGKMTAQVRERPVVGERCVVMGRLLEQSGRKTFTTTTGYGADGRILGQADAVWIALA